MRLVSIVLMCVAKTVCNPLSLLIPLAILYVGYPDNYRQYFGRDNVRAGGLVNVGSFGSPIGQIAPEPCNAVSGKVA